MSVDGIWPRAVPGGTAAPAALGAWADPPGLLCPSLVVPALLGAFSVLGAIQLLRTMRELRAARRRVAHLAATEERLRLARDLHDLLGHSLSLIALKSELAGRMLPASPADAARQVADIEEVSRQALVDVREAVTAYRPPAAGGIAAGPVPAVSPGQGRPGGDGAAPAVRTRRGG